MFLPIELTILTFVFKFVHPLSVFDQPSRDQRAQNLMTLGKVVQFIVETKVKQNNRRTLNAYQMKKAKALYRSLTKNMSPAELNRWLRSQTEPAPTDAPAEIAGLRDDQATLIESELQNALSQKHSALNDRPYVQQGRNDFLVMRPGILDPFVTVVPNDIYYNIEKKCVNWLDDCSLRGIRERLLSGVKSPYK